MRSLAAMTKPTAKRRRRRVRRRVGRVMLPGGDWPATSAVTNMSGMFDYALETAGGSVISTRCTETFVKKTAMCELGKKRK